MPNEKTFALARTIGDRLGQYSGGQPVTTGQDANGDVYLSMTGLLVLFQTSPRVSGKYDGIGLTQRVYAPHVVKIGVDLGTKATGDVTGATVVAGKSVTIGSNTYTADTDFDVGADDAETMANLANAINADGEIVAVVDGTTPEKLNLTAVSYGTGGNALALTDGGTGEFTVSGATLTGGLDGTLSPERLFLAQCVIARAGAVIKLCSKTSIAVADMVDDTYVVETFRNFEAEISGNI